MEKDEVKWIYHNLIWIYLSRADTNGQSVISLRIQTDQLHPSDRCESLHAYAKEQCFYHIFLLSSCHFCEISGWVWIVTCVFTLLLVTQNAHGLWAVFTPQSCLHVLPSFVAIHISFYVHLTFVADGTVFPLVARKAWPNEVRTSLMVWYIKLMDLLNIAVFGCVKMSGQSGPCTKLTICMMLAYLTWYLMTNLSQHSSVLEIIRALPYTASNSHWFPSARPKFMTCWIWCIVIQCLQLYMPLPLWFINSSWVKARAATVIIRGEMIYLITWCSSIYIPA